MIIKVEHLTKVYNLYNSPKDRIKEALSPFRKKYHIPFYALKDVSFHVEKGECFGIIGRNGSGKSTLLKIIAGVITPTSGEIRVGGRVSALLELGAGFNPEMTGIENIYLNATILGYKKEEIDRKLNEIIEFADIGNFIYQPVKMYSSGMFARLAFAVAINVEPDVLIVDEVLSVGDAAFQRKCFAKMEELKKRGITILFVSHDERTIVEFCNRVLFLHQGKKVIEGDPKMVVSLYSKVSNSPQIYIESIREEFNKKLNKQKRYNKNKKISKVKRLNENNMLEYFDNKLVSKSAVYYEEKGARISDVGIFTLNGKKVNVLVHGRKYVYSYKVDFFEDKQNVQFGMVIKTISGLGLGGAVYPGVNKYINNISSGTSVRVKWHFNALLNSFEYFLNAGVLILDEHGMYYAHRILDSYLFKILPIENNIITDFVDFDFHPEIVL